MFVITRNERHIYGVNLLAASALSIYLIQEQPQLRMVIWVKLFHVFDVVETHSFLINLFISVLDVFAVFAAGLLSGLL